MKHSKQQLRHVSIDRYARRPRTVRVHRLLVVFVIVISTLTISILWAGGTL